ncbi:MAG: YraN family protein [Acidimicrobiia bacterium]|nr:YraN family protein [Acidimicrobiia bacterium]
MARLGEAIAGRFLEKRGGRVIDRNRRVGRHEIDLVVEMDGMLVAVEVKTRRSADPSLNPLERIDASKLASLHEAAAALRCSRIDAVGVTASEFGVRVRWFPDIG